MVINIIYNRPYDTCTVHRPSPTAIFAPRGLRRDSSVESSRELPPSIPPRYSPENRETGDKTRNR